MTTTYRGMVCYYRRTMPAGRRRKRRDLPVTVALYFRCGLARGRLITTSTMAARIPSGCSYTIELTEVDPC